MTKGPELYERGRRLIPGGSQLLSKRPERFLPGAWPSYYESAEGIDVTGLDGTTYLDMTTMGLGACVLGYRDPDVDAAVKQAIERGTMTTLNCPEEVELAERLTTLHPWADMVRYARTGGEAMAIAVRIARASTGRDGIAFCGYHGWHDWYLSANLTDDSALDPHLLPGLSPRGVPRALRGTVQPFRYNDSGALRDIASSNGGEISAIVMEPIRNHDPDPDFIRTVMETAEELEAVLIVDEISSGFRITPGGAHTQVGLEPDIAVFAKALGNGYPIAAIIGTDDVMDAARGTFISSTYWTERIGPVAALSTIEKFQEEAVHDHLTKIGSIVQSGWEEAADAVGLPIEVSGIPPLAHFSIDCEENEAAHTLFTQILLGEGFLATNAFYPSLSHQEEHVQQYLASTEKAFREVLIHLEAGTLRKALAGDVRESGFARLT